MKTQIADLLWRTYKYNITRKTVLLYKQNFTHIRYNALHQEIQFNYKNYLFNECRIANKTSNYF